jgi:mono/diheme cytochrome c family protein
MAAALSKDFTWEGKLAVAAKTVDPLSAVVQRLFEVVRVLYSTICVSCHMPTGQGMAGVAPSLVDSRRATGSPDAVIRILLHGMQGTMVMPGFGSIPGLMDDEKVAGVLTYIRREWGNTADPISTKKVAEVREATLGRTQPWLEEELETWLTVPVPIK